MADELWKIRVQVEKHAIKKNSRNIRLTRSGRMFPGKSEALVNAEYRLKTTFAHDPSRPVTPFNFPLHVQFTFIFPTKVFFCNTGKRRGEISGRIPDLSNLYQLPEDCLQAAGIIEDDQLIYSHDGSRRQSLDGDNHYLEISIWPYIA